MDSRRVAYLKALDVDVWERRDLARPEPVAAAASQSAALSGWAELERAVKTCTLCPLHQTRTQGVFGVGNRNAQWMVIGEAPGMDEDRQGEPFVGRAGQLLNAMLKAIGLKREQVFIAKLRGQLHRIAGNRPMIVTYHPAYLLRSPGEKRKSWSDLLLALRTFEQAAGGAPT
jgi:uracil-DNA glycosylase